MTGKRVLPLTHTTITYTVCGWACYMGGIWLRYKNERMTDKRKIKLNPSSTEGKKTKKTRKVNLLLLFHFLENF